jgi:peptide/nickel transport system permease protein
MIDRHILHLARLSAAFLAVLMVVAISADLFAAPVASALGEALHGARRMVAGASSALAISLALGLVLGTFAGTGPAMADALLARTQELAGALPAIVLVALLDLAGLTSLVAVVLVVGVLRGLEVARLLRGELLKIQTEEFALAGRALGLDARTILRRHLLPHALGPALVTLAFSATAVVGLEAALCLVGLGPDEHVASWGRMLTEPGYGRLIAGAGIVLTTGALYALAELVRRSRPGRKRVRMMHSRDLR